MKVHARICGIPDGKTVYAHIGLLRYIRHVKGREHRVFFDPRKCVVKQLVTAFSRLSDLKFTPEAVVLVIGKHEINASWSSGYYIVRLGVRHKIQEDADWKSLAVLQLKTGVTLGWNLRTPSALCLNA